MEQGPELDLPGRIYEETPYNARMVSSDPLRFIHEGRVRDLYTDPYWAEKKGVKESFQVHFAPPTQLKAASDAGFWVVCTMTWTP